MNLQAGFAQIDITPPTPTSKVGWLKIVTIEKFIDPLFAKAAVLECGGERAGFIQLDTLSVRWSTVDLIRRRITEELNFPGQNIMVGATHNHAGPAVAAIGLVPRDDAYVASMVDRCVECFRQALAQQQPATAGFARKAVFDVAHNRRVVQRCGTVRTHGQFSSPDALCLEGGIDPELAVLALRGRDGGLLGTLVNFACHPTHHGSDNVGSAGWPGVLATEMAKRGCPVTMLLNGAAGDIHNANPASGERTDMDEVGERLASHVAELLGQTDTRETLKLSCASTTVQLPHREPTEEQVKGAARGAQRNVSSTIYDDLMPSLLERIARQPLQPAQVQTVLLDELAFVAIPAEYFSQLGLRIKEQTYPRHTLVVGFANGMVGYVPTKEAFTRGGYETTFAPSSRLAPEAGDLLADAAIELIRKQP